MQMEKILQGRNLTDTERTVLEYILDHLDTVQREGVRGGGPGQLHLHLYHYAAGPEDGVQRLCGYVL